MRNFRDPKEVASNFKMIIFMTGFLKCEMTQYPRHFRNFSFIYMSEVQAINNLNRARNKRQHYSIS